MKTIHIPYKGEENKQIFAAPKQNSKFCVNMGTMKTYILTFGLITVALAASASDSGVTQAPAQQSVESHENSSSRGSGSFLLIKNLVTNTYYKTGTPQTVDISVDAAGSDSIKGSYCKIYIVDANNVKTLVDSSYIGTVVPGHVHNLNSSFLIGYAGPAVTLQVEVYSSKGMDFQVSTELTNESPTETPNAISEAATVVSSTAYPNPVKDVLTVNLSKTDVNDATVSVYTTDGRLLNTNTINATTEGKVQLNMADYNNGMYIVSVAGKDWKSTNRITVAR
jgi:hypothetical protein